MWERDSHKEQWHNERLENWNVSVLPQSWSTGYVEGGDALNTNLDISAETCHGTQGSGYH